MTNKISLALLLALFAPALFAAAQVGPPGFPTVFYGVVSTTSGTPDGQALAASIGPVSTVVAPTSAFSCGSEACNYYITVNRAYGDTTTDVSFSINGHTLAQSGTFSPGAIVRLDFPSVPGSYLVCLLTTCPDGSCQAACPGGNSGTPGTGSGNGGGSGGSGGSLASTSDSSAAYQVDAGNGKKCEVAVKRQLYSGNTSSVLTTTLTNNGDASCVLSDFVFFDTIPDSFAAIGEIAFSPAYASKDGAKVSFTFPSFAPGESRSMTYTVSRWVPISRLGSFTTYSMSAAAIAPEQPEAPQNAQPEAVVPQEPVSNATNGPEALSASQQGASNPVDLAAAMSQQSNNNGSGAISILVTAAIVGFTAVVSGGVVYLLMARGKKGKGSRS